MIGDSHILNLVNPSTGSFGLTGGTFNVPFTRNTNYDFIAQTADILIVPNLTNAIEGVAVQFCVEGSGSYVMNFDTKILDGNGIQFDATKRNYITIIYSQGQFLRFITKIPIPIDGSLPTFVVKNINTIISTGAVFSIQTSRNATVKWTVTTSATTPSKADIVAGTGATLFGSQACLVGVQSDISLTGLTDSTSYYVYFYAIDAMAIETPIQPALNFSTASASFSSRSLSVGAQNQIPNTAAGLTKLSFSNGTTDVDFSVAFDIKFVSLTANRYIIYYGSGTNQNPYRCYLSSDGKLNFAVLQDSSDSIRWVTSVALTASVWNRITITYQASSKTTIIYVNNVAVSLTTIAAGTYNHMPALNSADILYIGDEEFLLDNFLIFDKKLLTADVNEIYKGGVIKSPSTLTFQSNRVVDYRFENNLLDSSSNAYNMTVTAAPTYSTDHI